MTQANIPEKWLRKVKLAHVPTIDEDGNQRSKQFAEINGALLVPVGEGHLFNTSASTLRRHIASGDLTPYLGNGKIKQSNGPGKVYFDLYEYLKL